MNLYNLAQHISHICVHIVQCNNFYMKICIFSWCEDLQVGWSQGRDGRYVRQNIKLSIWTVRTNYKKFPPKTKWLPNHKTDHNSLNFHPEAPDFTW